MRSVVRSSLPPEIKSSLDACWKEGVAAQAVLAVFDYYLVPFGLFLGASPQQVGFLVASPHFLSALAQLFSVRAVYTAGGRRTLLVRAAAVQAVMLAPLALLPLADFPWRMAALIALVSVFRVLGSLMGPAWGSLVSDYLPEGQRGQYMGWRSRVVHLAGIASLASSGLLLLALKGSQRLGFVLLFGAAAALRFISVHYMARMVEVDVPHRPWRQGVLGIFAREMRDDNVIKFVLYTAAVTFSTQLSAPYFGVHMLKHLKFDYLNYAAVYLASVTVGLLAFPVWGRHADQVGTARIMKSVSFLLPVAPLLWVFARHPAALVAVEAFSGFVQSGFVLASTNFLYDAVKPELRVRWLAGFNLVNGAAIFGGAALGGRLASGLVPVWGSPYNLLFISTSVLLLWAHFILSHRFEESRGSVRRTSSFNLFQSVLGLRPLAGETTESAVFPPLRPSRTMPS